MCGIAGVIDCESSRLADDVAAMSARLAHRGPDDAGAFVDAGAVGLAHHRLSILDLTAAGHQPMSCDSGRLTVVFNGEIYNYRELRRELEQAGVRFSTDSDTEVLLKAYQTWREACVERLVGMYAFAVWDRDQRSLFLARDRVGKKPLLYYWDRRTFAFASELKALLTLPAFERRLNPDAVDAYLALGYVPAPLCIFQNVFKLPPGHCMTVRGNSISERRYWFPERAGGTWNGSRDGRIERFRELFADAVRLRLRSDVPVGLYLSGGIDSSAIAAECVRQGQRLTAYTVAFDRDDTDLEYAKLVARHFDLEHQVIQASGENMKDDLPRIVDFYDEPFADTSNVPSYYIASQTPGHVKVVLNGDGGDEAFGGYRHYEYVRLKQFLKRLASRVGVIDGATHDNWQIYFQSKALFRARQRRELTGDRVQAGGGFEALVSRDPFLQAYQPANALKLAMWADRHIYLPNDLLFKMDIALMSHAIEGRSPFLDHRLLEWAQCLPPRDLVWGRTKKNLLRDAFRGELPAQVLDRPKHGFGAPIRAWLKGPLEAVIRECLPTPLLEREAQLEALQAFARNKRGAEMRVWTLMMFALWARQWRANW
jgi:asparagine synthase (glutamine-hydrolysing)